MDQKGLSLVLGTIVVAALLGLPRSPSPVATPAGPPPESLSPGEVESPPAPTGSAAGSAAGTADWSEVVRLYQESFGLPARERGRDLSALLSVLAERPAGTRLEFLVALVPDPLDSYMPERFDQAVDAIQQAYADPGSFGLVPSQHLLDRIWLPWTDPDAATARTWRTTPGALLFRDPRQGLLSTVFLVGESPKSGIGRESFRNALQVIRAVLPAGEPVRILGPTFSGSADSLEVALRAELKAEIVSGSATAQDLEALLDRPPRVRFCRTVVPDAILQRYAYEFLAGKMGWDLTKVAFLTEADTAYGQAATGQQQSQTDFVIIRFSSRLSRLRTASEREAERGGRGGLMRSSKTLLDLSLAEQGKPVDVVPQITPLTSRGNDLEIANLLETISREGIRYVGILATDVRDRLFLAERVRSFSKGIVLFTFDNNLLYAHPQVAPAMNGTLVLTSYPLFTEGQPWLPGGEWAGWRFRRQFTSELHQGVFLATRRLLAGTSVPEPRVWISVVGGGSLWPIASLPVAGEGDRFWTCGSSTAGPPSPGGGRERREAEETARVDLKVLLVMAFLFLLALWLRSIVPPKDTFPTSESATRTRWLLILGAAVLWVTGGVVTVLGALPLGDSDLSLPTLHRPFLAVLTVAYGALVWLIAQTVRTFTGLWNVTPGRGATYAAWTLGWVTAAALMLLALSWVLPWLWMPGGIPYFYLRLRNQASGLSPVTSLMWLGGGLFLWALLELKRYRLVVRQKTSWPFESCPERPLTGCAELAEDLRRLLEQSLFSRRFLRFWIVLVVALGFPVFLLAQILQPIAEIRPYGQVFLALAILLLVFAANSFYRFIAAWRTLSALLQRLDHTRLVKAFERISGEVRWNPMKGFGWQIPSFQTMALSVARLEDLAAHGKHVIPGGADALGGALARAFDADRRGDFEEEVRARREVGEVLSQASRDLAADLGDPEIADFVALRVVAWLRYVFAHLRNCLAGAMAPALLLLIAVTTWAFEPKQLVSFGIWAAVLGAAAVTLWTFVEMDRNTSLSVIGGSTPGKVRFDRSFFVAVFTYGVLPLAGVVTTQFPYFGRLFAQWFDPLMRLAGAE
jgi:hypothetical protein